jgi:hypothetical protein
MIPGWSDPLPRTQPILGSCRSVTWLRYCTCVRHENETLERRQADECRQERPRLLRQRFRSDLSDTIGLHLEGRRRRWVASPERVERAAQSRRVLHRRRSAPRSHAGASIADRGSFGRDGLSDCGGPYDSLFSAPGSSTRVASRAVASPTALAEARLSHRRGPRGTPAGCDRTNKASRTRCSA